METAIGALMTKRKRSDKIKISAVTVNPFYFTEEKGQAVNHKNEAADGNNAEYDPLGQMEGR